jgi:hypothetical protein
MALEAEIYIKRNKNIKNNHLINYKMSNLLYTIALILIIFWAIGFFAFSLGGMIHILLVLALIAVLVRIIKGR